MLTCYVALKYLGHPPRKQKQRETLLRTQAEHLHQQMFLGEVERGNFQQCVQGVQLLLAICVSLAQTDHFLSMSAIKCTLPRRSHAYRWMKTVCRFFDVTTSTSVFFNVYKGRDFCT